MHTNNEQIQTQFIEAIHELHQNADISTVKNDLLDMYKSSLIDDVSNLTPNQRFEKFHSFQHLYNFLLTIEMYQNPETTGINLLVS